jgi:hypothetical protein
VNSLLRKTHKAARWLLHVSNPDEPSFGATYEGQTKIDYYLVMARPEGTDDEIFDEVMNQFVIFPKMKPWNQRALFLVILTCTPNKLKRLAHKIFDVLWKTEKILNVVLLVPKNEVFLLHQKVKDTENSVAFELYTWFPYRAGHCGSVEEVTLMDQWIVNSSGDFLKQAPLFPNKIPTNLQACPLRVSTSEQTPLVVLNDVQDNDTFSYSGLEIQYLLIISQVMNVTLLYLPPPTGTALIQRVTMLSELYFGSCDLVVSSLPLNLDVMEFAEAAIPHLHTAFRWFIPCPTAVSRAERILGIFTLPVWFSLILVLVLTTAILWCSSNCHFGLLQQDSAIYKTVSNSLCNVWAVFLAVPLPKLPSSTTLRVFFLSFVWYCFAINIVFQAFFITFLVEPGYHKKIETFDELVESGLLYGYQEDTEIALNSTLYYEHTKIKPPRFHCTYQDECLERLITHGDIAMVSVAFITDYDALKLAPKYKNTKEVCILDEDIYKTFLVMYLQSGNPLLHRINNIIRRIIEAGLVDSYWSMAKWRVRVQYMVNSTHDSGLSDDNQYSSLSLSHLKIVFIIVTFGHILSVIVFTVELFYALISKSRKCNRK